MFDFHQEVDGYNEDNLGRNKIGASTVDWLGISGVEGVGLYVV